jgi:hypothetical protein
VGQLPDQFGLRADPLAHLGRVDHPGALAAALGLVHGDVGVAEQGRRLVTGGAGGDADAGPGDDDVVCHLHRLGQQAQDPLGGQLGGRGGVHVQQHRELVAAQP